MYFRHNKSSHNYSDQILAWNVPTWGAWLINFSDKYVVKFFFMNNKGMPTHAEFWFQMFLLQEHL